MVDCFNRLTVIGSKPAVDRFRRMKWQETLHSAGRFVCQFHTTGPLLECLKAISTVEPKLTLLLDYEVETTRTKGLAKAYAGALLSMQLQY